MKRFFLVAMDVDASGFSSSHVELVDARMVSEIESWLGSLPFVPMVEAHPINETDARTLVIGRVLGEDWTGREETKCPKCGAVNYREPNQVCASCEDGIS